MLFRGNYTFLDWVCEAVVPTGFEPVTPPWKGGDLNHLSTGRYAVWSGLSITWIFSLRKYSYYWNTKPRPGKCASQLNPDNLSGGWDSNPHLGWSKVAKIVNETADTFFVKNNKNTRSNQIKLPPNIVICFCDCCGHYRTWTRDPLIMSMYSDSN